VLPPVVEPSRGSWRLAASREPPDLSDPLYQDERVILTPHAAFVSEESLRELRTRASRQMAEALAGVRPANVVNPEVYARTT
jgi:D-3-phosphoglycerate dehydrogenase